MKKNLKHKNHKAHKTSKKKKYECPYDDHACRVYSFCGTQKCMNRGEKLRKEIDNENGIEG